MVTMLQISKVASEIAAERGEWCGAPVPIASFPLSIAEGYGIPTLNGATLGAEESAISDELGEWKIINSWWCPRRGGTVVIFEHNGKRGHGIELECRERLGGGIKRQLAVFEVAEVQDMEAELIAMDTLRQMIKPHLFAAYVLHGMILESSKKSGVTYWLRKGKPTIALAPDQNGEMKILCALCLHPLGYYEGTTYGAMVPTDEVIAHLIMIRAREAFFWRKANQHPAHQWQSGL